MTGIRGFRRAKGIRLLTNDQLDSIHEASLRIMGKSGVRFDSENARKHLLSAGCTAHPDRKDVIRFPRSVVNDAVKKIPRHPTFYARDPAWDVKYDGETMFPYSGGGDPKMVDLETGLTVTEVPWTEKGLSNIEISGPLVVFLPVIFRSS